MKKSYELKNIDDFVKDFNKIKLGSLVRISGELQESPDAICVLNDFSRIGLEATVAILPEDKPKSKIKKQDSVAYDPFPILDILINRIKEKSMNDYKTSKLDTIWLLISGGSYISDHDLRDRLEREDIHTKFERIFIHKGIFPKLLEIKLN